MTDAPLTPENDLFWLQRAGIIIDGTAEKFETAAKRLADAMAWFWTAYSAVALVAVATTAVTDSTAVAVVVAAPSVLIFGAYLAATLATLPVQVKFDDRRPDQIKSAHERAMAVRSRRIRVSTVLACVSALSVAAAVAVATLAKRPSTAKSLTDATLSSDQTQLLVGGSVAAESVVVEVTAPNGVVTERLVTVSDEMFDLALPLTESGTHAVRVTWTSGDRTHSTTQEVEKEG